MRTSENKSILSFFARPLAGCTLIMGAAAFLTTGQMMVCAWVAGSCLLTTATIGFLLSRSARENAGRLRGIDARSPNVMATGVFREVVEMAASMLKLADDKSQQTLRLKTELEARLHLRQQLMRQLEAALNQFEQPVVITDARGLPSFCNAAAVGLFVASEPHAPISWADDIDLDRVPALHRLIDEFRHVPLGNQRRSVELELNVRNRATACEAIATLIPGPERTLGVVTVIHDISEKRQEKTRHAEFVASVCHELKTPMAGIRAFTEMLIDGEVDDPQEQKQILGFIEIQVDRLTRLADNMLNLSRMESGVIKVQREDSELNEILHKALRVVQPAAEQKGINLVSELSDLYLAVNVDRDLFAQAIINLLSNAVKYTPSGGEVRLRSRMHERQAIIEVSDNGLGIPESSLSKIFDRFYRVPENNKAAEGTGLGLALVHYIVTELHNGGISVDSTVGKGSCFTIQVSLGHRDQQRGRAEQPVGVHRTPEPCVVLGNPS